MCKDRVQMLSIQKAAKLVDHSPRTIHRYIEAGEIYNLRVTSHGRLLVCASCLLQDPYSPQTPVNLNEIAKKE